MPEPANRQMRRAQQRQGQTSRPRPDTGGKRGKKR